MMLELLKLVRGSHFIHYSKITIIYFGRSILQVQFLEVIYS